MKGGARDGAAAGGVAPALRGDGGRVGAADPRAAGSVPTRDAARAARAGVLFGLAAYGSWGVFPLYFKLIREMGAGKAAYTSVVTPIIAMVLSTLFEGYRWTGLAVAGSALAMLGLLIALSGRK